MSTHARPLAVWLAAASDQDLEALFSARGVRPDATWNDFFDAAEALLDPASVDRALSTLTRPEATALLQAADGQPIAGEVHRSLVGLALLRPDSSVPPPVAEALAGRTVSADSEAPSPAHSASEPQAHAAERAFTSLTALADTLILTRDTPLHLLAGGTVGAAEKRRLSERGVNTDGLDDLLILAAAAELTTPSARTLALSDHGQEWLRASVGERWSRLVSAFRDTLPRGLRIASGGWQPLTRWPAQHPWDPSWPARCTALSRRAALLGLIAEDGSEPEWARSTRADGEPQSSSLERMLPTEVDRLFLQNDLTAIAPGPLAPSLDVRLRSIAERESTAQASSYRFTAESIRHGLIAGETEESIRELLSELSLTGIPQPLSYLITQTAQRHGLVRVSSDAATGQTRIDSVDEHLLDAMAVDQALRPLGLSREAGMLSTRVGRETVYWALTDARYPATLVDADGRAISPSRAASASTPLSPVADHSTLIARLRSHEGGDADAAWLDRELEGAVRSRAVLLVEVGMPDGSTRELTLEATGLGGGRLRGRDRAADVERTLPVSSIRSARVIES
ncbi:MAG: helicase-associated domain-containing protein [Actinomycetota bacterium]